MKQAFTLLFFLNLFCYLHAQEQEVTFVATSDRQVYVNQPFNVKYCITTSYKENEKKDISLKKLEDFVVLDKPNFPSINTYSHTVNKNKYTYSYQYTYTLLAKKEGNFILPSAICKIGDKEYESNELEINVRSNEQNLIKQDSIRAEDIFLKLELSKNSVYENEELLATFKLYSLKAIKSITKLESPDFDGFIAQDVTLPDQREFSREYYNGQYYNSVVVKQSFLYPQHTGIIIIDSLKSDVIAQIKKPKDDKPKSIFDDFFDNYTEIPVSISSSPITINVKALPKGKLATFANVVGEYNISSSVDEEDIRNKGAVLFTVSITGKGNIKYIPAPFVNFPKNVDVQRLNNHVNLTVDSTGIYGTKTFEYRIIPQGECPVTIPPVEFSFFDVASKKHKTIKTDTVIIPELKKTKDVNPKNIVFAIDVSTSMLAQDFTPNRLEAAKTTIADFINSNFHENYAFGLVAFAQESCIVSALTNDYSYLTTRLKAYNSKMLKDGTAIGDGVAMSLAALKDKPETSGTIILITDGANNCGEIYPTTSSEIAKLLNVKIYTIGLTTFEETLYPIVTMQDTLDTIYVTIPIDIDEKMLTSMAENTGGKYFRASNKEELLQIVENIKQMEATIPSKSNKPVRSLIDKEYARQVIEEIYYNSSCH
jgi:hypothetical protein